MEIIRKKVAEIRADPQWKDTIAKVRQWREKAPSASSKLPPDIKKIVGEMAWHCCPSYTSQALTLNYQSVRDAQDSTKDPRIVEEHKETAQSLILKDPEFQDLLKRIGEYKAKHGRGQLPFDLKKDAFLLTLKHPVSWVSKYTKVNYHECRDAKLRLEAAKRRAIVTRERPKWSAEAEQPKPPEQPLATSTPVPETKPALLATFTVGKLVAEFYEGGARDEAKKLLGDFLEGIKDKLFGQ
jgi:hypothetical protein